MPSSETTPPLQSHYELLGVSRTATSGDLRRAFRGLSKLYHPDTTSLPRAQAEEAFLRLRQAYAVLSDPGERRRYDALLIQPPVAFPSAGPVGSGAAPFPAASAMPGVATGRPVGVRRALSGGEWFALLLLGLALALSLVLGIGVAWARGMELVRSPSWSTDTPAAGAAAADPGSASDAALIPPFAPDGPAAT